MPKKIVFIGAFLVGLALIYRVLSFTPELVSFSGPTMGTTYTVKLYTNKTAQNVGFIKDEIDLVLQQVNKTMSTYDPSSELSLLNQATINESIAISDELNYVIKTALEISEEAGGAYDITVGPLANLWGFGPQKQPDRVPTEQEIAQAKMRVGYQLLTVEDKQLLKNGNVYIDLSSIAKGFGVDQVASRLDEFGITSYLVEIGGEIVAKGTKDDGSLWRIAIEKPNGGHSIAQKIIDLDNVAIATSGDYRNYFERNGVRYSHLIDPKTGKPITHKLVSVTVIANSTVEADGYSTAINILGPDKGLDFAERKKLPVYMLVKTDLGFIEKYSSSFEPYLSID
ncbi:FAD:protein FMN transferase [Marinomonas agarivorans]|nr:FAD:protein FMN transferase [Marinomonas agarivorans]